MFNKHYFERIIKSSNLPLITHDSISLRLISPIETSESCQICIALSMEHIQISVGGGQKTRASLS